VSEPTAKLYKELFEDDRRGAAILEDLTRRFARPAVTTGGIDAVLQTYHRDGMRRVVEFIVTQINRANGVDTSEQENEE
jgi:hypothetical protein